MTITTATNNETKTVGRRTLNAVRIPAYGVKLALIAVGYRGEALYILSATNTDEAIRNSCQSGIATTHTTADRPNHKANHSNGKGKDNA